MKDWKDSVEEHREALERIADFGGPLSDDCERLLEEYDSVTND